MDRNFDATGGASESHAVINVDGSAAFDVESWDVSNVDAIFLYHVSGSEEQSQYEPSINSFEPASVGVDVSAFSGYNFQNKYIEKCNIVEQYNIA